GQDCARHAPRQLSFKTIPRVSVSDGKALQSILVQRSSQAGAVFRVPTEDARSCCQMMWSEKYRPKTVQEMVGNESARLAALKWLTGWVSGSKPLLLVGPPGTGKTTLAHVLRSEEHTSELQSRENLVCRLL